MESRLQGDDVVTIDQIDEAMFFVYPARPAAGENMAELLRFTNALKRRSRNLIKESIHSLEGDPIVGHPPLVVIPAVRREHQPH